MKRFLQLMALFLLPIMAVAIGLEIVVQAIPNSYIYKRKYVEEHGGKIKILILGSSNTYDGICPKVLPMAFNMANSSQTIEDDYRLLERYIDSMDSLQTIIIGLGYHSLGAETEDNRRTYYTIYMDLYPRWPINRYSFEVFNFQLLIKKIIKYVVSRDVTRCDLWGQRVGHSIDAVREKNEFWNKDALTLAEIDKFQISDVVMHNIGYLHSMIEICEEHHVQPVIVTMPVMAQYKEALPLEQVALHDSVMHKLPSHAIYIDASDWSIPVDGWYNATHLTREASVEFSRQLMDSILLQR